MDFLANENFPYSSINILRDRGHRVVSIIQESPGTEDRTILERAHSESLIILTFDRDYGELIYRYKQLPPVGLVYFRFSPATPTEPAELLLNALELPTFSIQGNFTIIERGRIRQRAIHSSG